jgi:hypothetical protein
LFEVYLIKFKLNLIKKFKNPTNNGKLECMEYICDKIITITELEKNCIYTSKLGVTTLALGSRPRQGFARVRAKREARECGRV